MSSNLLYNQSTRYIAPLVDRCVSAFRMVSRELCTRVHRQPIIGFARGSSVSSASSPFFQFCSKRSVLVVQDGENISISARKHGFGVDQQRFAATMKRCCRSCRLLTFASGNSQDRVVGGPYPSPWELHFNQVEIVSKMGEWQRRSNSDNLIFFTVGNMINQVNVDTVVLMTGDGDLASDLARFVKQACMKPISVATLSVPFSTAGRLVPGYPFDANFEIGYPFLV